jgi:putative ABC transport system permease protein
MTADHLRQDFRHAVRRLIWSPMYALVTVATLGLGIGANTAIFSVVNGVILRPLPYPKPDQLTYLTTRFPAFGFDQFWVSPPEYFEFRELNKSFSAVGAFTTGEANLSAGDRPRRVRTANVDDHLLTALGIQPAAGRLFRGSETVVVGPPPGPGAPPLPVPPFTILSYELWQSAFGGRDMIGQTVEVNGLAREVIGIMPPGADVMDNRTEIWFPLGLNPAVRTNRGSHFLYLIGRLKEGVTPQQAQTELAALLGNWGERVGLKETHVFRSLAPGVDPKTNPGAGHILQMEPMREELIGSAGRAIWVLQAAVGFVLLIACANLANLLLARAETRHREFAVRTALGAGRWHLVRQFMAEGLLLSIAGGALGLVVARLGVQALVRMYPTTLPRTSELSIDPIVLLFTVAVSMATGLLFGLAPLMHTRASGLLSALKDGGAKGATSGVRGRVRSALVVIEVALAVMLVIGASLLLRTVWNLTQIDAGFDRSRLVTFTMALPQARYPQPPSRAQLYQRLLGKLRAIPGVQGATAMSGLPPNRPLNANDTDIGSYTAPPEGPYENVDYYQSVMTGYFETMGIPIVQGRPFQASDATTTGLVAIVNETFVNTFWKNVNPIGQQLRPCCGDRPWFTVVGVAKDVKQGGVDQKTGTESYFLIDQTANQAQFAQAPGTLNIVLRTSLPAGALRSAIEHAVRETDASVPIARLQDMNGVFEESIRRPRLLAHLLGGFAGIALLLAAIGTYGVLSYMVAQRRREIGVRMALGADRGRVLAHVLKQGLALTTIGIVGGLAGAFALNQVIASLLFGVRPTDPTTLALVVMTIVAVAIGACWLPAWRASRLDPNAVLRSD